MSAMRLKAYWLFAKNTFQESFSYRRNALMGVVFQTLAILLRVLVWIALYAGLDGGEMMGRTLEDMLTYSIVVSIVGTITSSERVASMLEERMKSGEIALDSLRPTAPRGMLVARSWGDKLLWMVNSILPVALCILVVGGIGMPQSGAQALLFALSLVLGYLINLMFDFLTATFAFRFVSVNTLRWFIGFFTTAMSGAIVPLWLLPGWLQAIARALPFQATTAIPMQIYMGQMDAAAFAGTILVQVAWIVGLGVLQQVLWQRGMRRLVVHGG